MMSSALGKTVAWTWGMEELTSVAWPDDGVVVVEILEIVWPEGEASRLAAALAGKARLLVVSNGSEPPLCGDVLEDWIRESDSAEDRAARLSVLLARMAEANTGGLRVGADGIVRRGEAWVALPHIEAALAGVLFQRVGAVVSRDALGKAAWPDGTPSRNLMDVHMLQLRRRLSEIDIEIRTVRSRGYLLENPDISSR